MATATARNRMALGLGGGCLGAPAGSSKENLFAETVTIITVITEGGFQKTLAGNGRAEAGA